MCKWSPCSPQKCSPEHCELAALQCTGPAVLPKARAVCLWGWAVGPWGAQPGAPAGALCAAVVHWDTSVCAIKPSPGDTSCLSLATSIALWGFFMTFSCLPSLPPPLLCAPLFTRANSSPLSPDPWKKKKSFLYNLLLIFSVQYLRQLLCRSPAVQIALHRGRSSCHWLTGGARSSLRDFWNLRVGKSAGTCVQFWIRP